MKKLLFPFTVLIISVMNISAQEMELEAPRGFDEVRTGIATGKLDSITYRSETVGTTRKALVYIPPGFDKKKKYPVLLVSPFAR